MASCRYRRRECWQYIREIESSVRIQHIMRYAVQAIERFISAPAWQSFNLTPYGPFNGVRAGSDLEAYITNNSETCVFLVVDDRYLCTF
jgi:hypothetical protein